MRPRYGPFRYRSGAEEPEVAPGRIALFGVAVVGLFILLISRLWFLQIVRGETFRAQASANQRRKSRIVPPRGVIEDRKGRPLVTNASQITAFIIPSELPSERRERAKRQAVFRRLAELLPADFATMRADFDQRRAGPSDPVMIQENISAHALARLVENQSDLPGVVVQVEPIRRYPYGSLAAHVLGHIGEVDADNLKDRLILARGYRPGDFIGQNGIERQYDALLCGREGGIFFEVDRQGRRQREISVEEPVAGGRLTLTLDLTLQKAAEAALAKRHGAVVALDPQNGRVLAMASYPTFDPNLLARRPLSGVVYRKQIAPGQRNRATMGGGAPGSTFKIVTTAAGLSSGKIGVGSGAFCPGYLRIGRSIKRCNSHHGGVSLLSAFAASCNTFFCSYGIRIGPESLAEWARRFGLGRRSGIDLPSEYAGTVPDPEWKRRWAPRFNPQHPDPRWYEGDTANVAIGQGDVVATPLQIAQLSAAVANGGTLYQPHCLLRAVASDDPSRVLAQEKIQVAAKLALSAEQIQTLRACMRGVVASPGGTSRAAFLPGIFVAGKSGSAEHKRTAGEARVSRGATDGWFTCFAGREGEPAKIALCVWRESRGENLHGGADAAPIARKVLATFFGVRDAGAGGGAAAARD